jgi:hypothetical protein
MREIRTLRASATSGTRHRRIDERSSRARHDEVGRHSRFGGISSAQMKIASMEDPFPRGTVIGRQVTGRPLGEAENYFRGDKSGGWF